MSISTGPSCAPIQIGPVVARGVQVWRAHLLAFTLLGLIAQLPNTLLELLLYWHILVTTSVFHHGMINAPDAGGYALLGFGFLARQFGEAVVLVMTCQDVLGADTSLIGAAGQVVRRFAPLVLGGLCAYLAVALGFLLLVIPGVIMVLALSVYRQVCIIEERGPIASLSRSAELTRGSRARIFGLLLLYCGMWFGLMWGAVWVSMLAGWPGWLAVKALDAMQASVTTCIMAVLYYELRVSREGAPAGRLASVFD